MQEPAPIKKYAAEATGTFCLVFAGTIVIDDVLLFREAPARYSAH
jgi:hypothetical protein